MSGLYEAGWRQGSVFTAILDLCSLVASNGGPVHRSTPHDRWLVATQDCDLSQLDESVGEPEVELRPVFSADPPVDWGIRSARLLLQDAPPLYIISRSPRLHAAPAVLSQLLTASADVHELCDERRRALKTWLGLRYDRPAVPEHLVNLARAIAREVSRRPRREVGMRVRDVLMQFDDAADPPRFSLFAVLAEPSDEHAVRLWLADVARSVPAHLGIGDELEAAPASGISYELVEASYAADVSH